MQLGVNERQMATFSGFQEVSSELDPRGKSLELADIQLVVDSALGKAHILRGVDLNVAPGEVVAIAGESGCGKSTLLRSIVRFVPPGGQLSGSIHYGDVDLLQLRKREIASFRASTARMIFQDPWSSLHPMKTIGWQLVESVRTAFPNVSKREATEQARAVLTEVGVTDVDARLSSYPHEVSGGQAQRIMIAMALVAEPEMLLCDEPTTALDVTTQALILELLRRLSEQRGISVVIATHDLTVISDLADRVAVMYAGRVVEEGRPNRMFSAPNHPYTYALLKSAPQYRLGERLIPIDGMAPPPLVRITGCAFADRCEFAVARCRNEEPELQFLDGCDAAATACLRHEGYAASGVVSGDL